MRWICILLSIGLRAAYAHDAGDLEVSTSSSGWSSVSLEGFDLRWTIEGDTIRFDMTAPTTGWLAVGFGGGPAMAQADMVIGYVGEQGEPRIQDGWGTGPVSHAGDTELGGSGDLEILRASEEEGITSMSFSRLLDTEDEYDFPLRPGTTLRLSVAWGADEADDFDSMHQSAHSATIEVENVAR
ncbi:DOMON domain-containing protein [Candidatus Fermentibacteria bacterium]|nr:DOMON domain-containing protein [Candidatus Fermentibacteria bacterium]